MRAQRDENPLGLVSVLGSVRLRLPPFARVHCVHLRTLRPQANLSELSAPRAPPAVGMIAKGFPVAAVTVVQTPEAPHLDEGNRRRLCDSDFAETLEMIPEE